MFNRLFGAVALMVIFNGVDAQACSSCACSYNSDWASEGYSNGAGVKFDVRFDYIRQKNLRRGTDKVSFSDFEFPTDEEVQKSTITRSTLLGIDYSPDASWGIKFNLPIINRSHSTIMEGDTELMHSHTSGIGDLSVVARYQGFSKLKNTGVEFGIKFPTGSYDDDFHMMEDSDHEGHEMMEHGMEEHEETGHTKIDRGLQNGTGTYDGFFGIYHYGYLTDKLEYVLHTSVMQPFTEREDFRMGTNVITTFGVSYRVSESIRPQVQVNYHYEARESGAESDHDNSGGNFIDLTPGVAVNISNKLTGYVLVQVPVYQNVNGLQLRPNAIWSVGVRYAL